MSALQNMTVTRQPADVVEMELLNHCICHKTSFLCAKILESDRRLKAYQSGGRWYLGVINEDGSPYSRDSQYFPSEEAAQEALDNRQWEQRLDP